jgi:hypothetical protein
MEHRVAREATILQNPLVLTDIYRAIMHSVDMKFPVDIGSHSPAPEGSTEPSEAADWSEFTSLLNTPNANGNDDLAPLKTMDASHRSLKSILETTIENPTAKNMFAATRQLSQFDLQTLLVGKVVDKTTKGIDRMLNLQ